MGKVITMKLTTRDIERAIKEVEAYKKDFIKKVDIFRERVAQEIKDLAQLGFDSSMVDDVIPTSPNGSSHNAKVTVSCESNGNITVVATGKNDVDAIWVEFGAGVYHNGSVGSSPNPQGAKLGYTIGGYGDGHGKQNVWGYYEIPGDRDTLVLTHGTPATMPMYNAMKTISAKVIDIAREVFNS